MPLKKEQIIIRISSGLKQKVERVAKQKGITVSEYIRDMLEMHIDSKNDREKYILTLKELTLLKEQESEYLFQTNNVTTNKEQNYEKLSILKQNIELKEKAISIYLKNGEI